MYLKFYVLKSTFKIKFNPVLMHIDKRAWLDYMNKYISPFEKKV